jgi:hypothetical protein
VATGFLTRARREGEDEDLLASHDRDPALKPHILSVRPPAGSPVPSRLERDTELVAAALEAGRQGLHRALSGISSSQAATARQLRPDGE